MEYIKFYEEFNTSMFNIDILKQLKSFKAKEKYCNETLTRVAAGSSRIVYRIDNNRVLKLAKNNKGYLQNYKEYDVSKLYSDIVAKVLEDGYNEITDKYDWLISEAGTKISKKKFEVLSKINFDKYSSYISYEFYSTNPQLDRGGHSARIAKSNLTEQDFDYILNECDDFVHEVCALMADYEIMVGDLTRISSYGTVKRNGEDVLVLLDYGADKDYFNL